MEILDLDGLKDLLAKQLDEVVISAIKAATHDEVKLLLEGRTHQHQVGDLVKWRTGAKNARWPQEDEVCVVTQVLATPYRGDAPSSPEAGDPRDIALAFVHRCGNPDCKREGEIAEYLYDGRRFEKVGSINN